jgi:amino acid transporter
VGGVGGVPGGELSGQAATAQQGTGAGRLSSTGARIGGVSLAGALLLGAGLVLTRLGRGRHRAAHRA